MGAKKGIHDAMEFRPNQTQSKIHVGLGRAH